jgi:hypothetical protein
LNGGAQFQERETEKKRNTERHAHNVAVINTRNKATSTPSHAPSITHLPLSGQERTQHHAMTQRIGRATERTSHDAFETSHDATNRTRHKAIGMRYSQ